MFVGSFGKNLLSLFKKVMQIIFIINIQVILHTDFKNYLEF